MSSGLKFWCILLFIPVLASIAHDTYHSYYSTPEKQQKLQNLEVDPKSYQISDFGYMVMNYLPEVYDSAKSGIGEQAWNTWVDPVLRQYTIVVALIPNILLWAYLLIARVLGFPPFRYDMDEYDAGKGRANDPLEKRRSKAVKYTRR